MLSAFCNSLLLTNKINRRSQAIRWQQPTNCFSVFCRFVRLALKGLIHTSHPPISCHYFISMPPENGRTDIFQTFTESIKINYWPEMGIKLPHFAIKTAGKASVFGVFLLCIFPLSGWIQRDTPYASVFSPNARNYGSEKIRIRTLFSKGNVVALCNINLLCVKSCVGF